MKIFIKKRWEIVIKKIHKKRKYIYFLNEVKIK
jgi:hypothetical protein